jgi:hypothetical protein
MITAFVKGQKLTVAQTVVAADAVNYLTARFVFQTGDWLADGISVWAHFKKDGTQIDADVTDGTMGTDAGVNLSAGKWTLWLTGHITDDAVLIQRITTIPVTLNVSETGDVSPEPLPVGSFGEAILGAMQDAYSEVSAVRAEVDGITAEAETLLPGSEATASAGIVGGAVRLSFGIPQGDKGDKGDKGNKGDRGYTGNGISGITLISTSGLDKTYRITFTDGNHYDFTVHDGNGIASIVKTGTSGVTDTYTITMTDGSTATFDVVNGGAYAVRNAADGTYIRLWAGTEQQYEAAEKSADTIYLVDLGITGGAAPTGGEGT